MAESMAGIECFPAMLTEMVGVGERSGALEETLDVIGGYYDNRCPSPPPGCWPCWSRPSPLPWPCWWIMLLLAV